MKKFFAVFSVVAITIITIPLIAAFEAHVINVFASIENSLTVASTHIDFGRVYPQMEVDKTFTVNLSDTFLTDPNVDDVDYIIRQKPKCAITSNNGKDVDLQFTATGHVVLDPQGVATVDCGNPPRPLLDGEEWGALPLLCRYLSKHKQVTESPENDTELAAFHDIGYINNNGTPGNPSDDFWVWTEVGGRLAKSESDTADTWVLDLKTPCFDKHCAQDWDEFVRRSNGTAVPANFIEPNTNEKKVYGCDLWIEVTRVGGNGSSKTFCGDGIKQTPNETGTGGPLNDGNEACDGSDGVTPGFNCTASCTLEKIPECTQGDERLCDTGLLGVCSGGTQTCSAQGAWGTCTQNTQASAEVCDNTLDDDCDGKVDQNDEDCQIACFDKTDMMLVLDRSNSIDSTELGQLKTAAHSFVTSINPTTAGNHMGQTDFSTFGRLDLHLTGDKTLVDNAIDALTSGAFTNLMEGIVYASNELADTHTAHERPAVPDFMIIITDGNPNRPVNSTVARAQAKAAADTAKAAGATLYVVGVGSDVDAAYLKTIASGDDHYYPVADFASLSQTLAQIASCR